MPEYVTVVSPQGDRRVVSRKAATVIYTQHGWKVEQDASADADPADRPDTGRPDPDPQPDADPDRADPDAETHPAPGALTPPAGNASRVEWVLYANSLGVAVPKDATRKDIRAHLADHGYIPAS